MESNVKTRHKKAKGKKSINHEHFDSLSFSNAKEAINLLVELNKVVKYIEKQKPYVPQCKFIVGNPFQIKINHGTLISNEKLSQYDKSILLNYINKWKKNCTDGLKLNIILLIYQM